MTTSSEPLVYNLDVGDVIFELHHDENEDTYHVLEKEESELELYEDHYDCQGDHMILPNQMLATFIKKIKENQTSNSSEIENKLYLYTKRKEILKFQGPYKEFDVIIDQKNTLLHQPFVQS